MATFTIVSLNMQYVVHNRDFMNTNGICKFCSKPLINETSIVGKCHHAFHSACTATHDMHSCPIDNTIWIQDYIISP